MSLRPTDDEVVELIEEALKSKLRKQKEIPKHVLEIISKNKNFSELRKEKELRTVSDALISKFKRDGKITFDVDESGFLCLGNPDSKKDSFVALNLLMHHNVKKISHSGVRLSIRCEPAMATSIAGLISHLFFKYIRAISCDFGFIGIQISTKANAENIFEFLDVLKTKRSRITISDDIEYFESQIKSSKVSKKSASSSSEVTSDV